jgi:hypothetical protein
MSINVTMFKLSMDSQVTQFTITDSSKKQSFRRRIRLVNGLTVLFIGFVLVALFDLTFHTVDAWNFDRENIIFFGVWMVAAVLALRIFFNDRKTTFNFTLREDGIQTNAGFYPWKVMKDYHWLGEAQEERVGIIGLSSLVNYDPLNPYRAAGIYIARIRLTRSQNRQRRLNLYVDPERVATFEKLCEQHGLPRLTRVRLFLFGTNPYPLIVFIRVVPQ